jgi:hypothetical protein
MANITIPRDNNNTPYPVPILGANTHLDGSSAAATSDVISATEESVVRLASADTIYFQIGFNPTADAEDIILSGGDITLRIPANQKISVFGGLASLTVLH